MNEIRIICGSNLKYAIMFWGSISAFNLIRNFSLSRKFNKLPIIKPIIRVNAGTPDSSCDCKEHLDNMKKELTKDKYEELLDYIHENKNDIRPSIGDFYHVKGLMFHYINDMNREYCYVSTNGNDIYLHWDWKKKLFDEVENLYKVQNYTPKKKTKKKKTKKKKKAKQ